MIRPFTLITMMLAMLSGAYLFAVKHRAQLLDDQLSAVADQTRQDEQRIRVLQAQWSLEIDPTRLSRLAHQFTSLQPMRPAQLTTLTNLASALPAPGSLAPGANPVAPMPDMPQTAAAAAPASVASASPAASLPLPPPAQPAALRLASAEARPESPQGRPAAPHVQRNAAVKEHRSPSHSHVATDEFAENLPPPRPVHSLYPIGAQIVSVRATSAGATGNGSALAMGADLAPPQPLAGANN
jgi:hypothetical protein